MAKQRAEKTRPPVVDEALRRQVAQWVKEALGELLEEDGTGVDQAVAAPNPMRYSRGAGRDDARRDPAYRRTIHKKEV